MQDSENIQLKVIEKSQEINLVKILDTIDDMVFELSVSGHFLYVNPSFLNKTGFRQADLSNLTIWDVLTEKDKNTYLENFNRLLKSGDSTAYQELDLISKSGEILHTGQKIDFLTDGKKLVHIYVVARDITELINTRRAIKLSEARYKSLVENVGDIIFELNGEGKFTYINPTTIKLTGYSGKELMNMHYLQLIDPEGLDNVTEFYKKQIKSKTPTSYYELVICPKKGKNKINVGLRLEFVFEEDLVVRTYAIARDITELIRARKELAESEEKYRLISESARDLISLHKPDGEYTYASPSSFELLGYKPNELIGNSVFNYFHPDDLKAMKANSFKDLVGNKGKSNIEYRIARKDGEYVWFESYNRPIRDKTGNVIAYQSSTRDISKRKAHELKLQKTDVKLGLYKEGLKTLNEITSNIELTSDQQLSQALWLSTEFLGLDCGIITEVVNNDYKVLKMYGEDIYLKSGFVSPFDQTFCQIAYAKEAVLSIEQVSKTTYKVHPCYENRKIECYIGIPYYVSGQKRGTIHFSSIKPRAEEFDLNEQEFVKLLAQWIGFILQHQEYEKKLMADKMILQAFVMAAPAAIAMFDKDLRYITASDKWYSEYDLEDEYIIGRSYFEVFPEIGQEWEEIFQRALSGNTESNDQDLFERANGEIKWIKWEVKPWYSKLDTIGGLIMHTEDISQQKEQQLQLKIAKRKAEQASKAKEQFLSTMSHEIRTPLNAIIGMTDLMLMEDQDDEQLKRLKLLKFSGENLLVLINDILDFNKIEAGKLEFEIADFNLRSLLERSQGSMQNITDRKGIELHLNFDENIPKYVKGDVVRLGQVITNLVNNAIKFTEKGYVSLKVRLVHKDDHHCTIKFEIKDTGIGIPDRKLKTIFESFEQGGADITRKYGGSGLGLAITKKLLTLMNSGIQVHSTEGLGSVFFFELTLPIGEKPAETEKIIDAELRSNLKLLVAEDNPGNRVLIESLFKKWNIGLDFAFDGTDAVRLIQSQKYDMVFMDLQMPEMDGYEATETIRAMEGEYYKKIAIVALTASVMSNVLEKTKQVGMNNYVSKPFNPNQLRQIIAKYTNGHFEPVSAAKPIHDFPYLVELIGDDHDAITAIIQTTIKSISHATEGLREGLDQRSLDRVRKEMHVLRPNLHNLELGYLVVNFAHINDLEENTISALEELLLQIDLAINSARLQSYFS